MEYLWVGLGGFLGANARYLLSRFAARVLDTSFPYGTLLINVSGSLLLGFFLVWTTERVLADPGGARERCERARRLVEREYCREPLVEGLATELARRFG